MTTQSKAVSGDAGMGDHAGITDMVYEIHRRSHHYSLKKKSPDAYNRLLQEVEKIDIEYVREAYTIYKSSKQEDEKLPHPNYFLAICKRLAKETKTKKKEKAQGSSSWGKTI